MICSKCSCEVKRVYTCECQTEARPNFKKDPIALFEIVKKINQVKQTQISAAASKLSPVTGCIKTLAELEKDHILMAFKKYHQNKVRTAQALGITVKTLYNKLEMYGEHTNEKRIDT